MGEAQQTDRVDTNGDESTTLVEEWKPSLGVSIVWTVLAVLFTVVGFFLFTVLYVLLNETGAAGPEFVDASIDEDGMEMTVRFSGALPLIAVSIGVLLLHEAVHGIAFRFYGGRTQFGVALVQKILPVLYCTAPGYFFTRLQFTVIILAPLVAISIAGIAMMPFVSTGLLLVVPLAINFGGAVGDIWFVGLILRREPGTMIEDLKDGLRFHRPRTA
jgi:hypothetical protein